MGRLGHRVATRAPRAGHPHETGRELPSTAMALVLLVEGDGRERAAVGAAGAQRAHTTRSHVSLRRATCIPTRS